MTLISLASLVAFYNCNEGAGLTTANAVTGADLLTYNVANWNAGRIRNGVSVNASNQLSGLLNNCPTGSAQRTLHFWVNLVGLGANDTAVSWGSAVNNQAFSAQFNSTTNFHFSGWNDDVDWTVSTWSLNTTTWYQVVLTYDGNTTLELFVNGVSQGTKTLANQLNTSGNTLNVGKAPNGGALPNGMVVDMIGVWGRILQLDEINFLYNSGMGLEFPFRGAKFGNILRPRIFRPGIAR